MSATEAQAEVAICVLKRMIDAAENGNQAGEDAVVVAAAGPDLLVALTEVTDELAEFASITINGKTDARMAGMVESARAAIAKATGSQVAA